jgi:hypothetical protein
MAYANKMRGAVGQVSSDEAKKQIMEFDPVPLLRTLSIPVLALFGGNDTVVNTEESIVILESIRAQQSKNITIHSFQSANHGMMVFPQPSEPFRWFGLADGYLETLTNWTSQQIKAD